METTFIRTPALMSAWRGTLLPAAVAVRSRDMCIRYRQLAPCWKLMARAVPPVLPSRPKKNTTAAAAIATTRPRAKAIRMNDRRPDGAFEDCATHDAESSATGAGAGGGGTGMGGGSGSGSASKMPTVAGGGVAAGAAWAPWAPRASGSARAGRASGGPLTPEPGATPEPRGRVSRCSQSKGSTRVRSSGRPAHLSALDMIRPVAQFSDLVGIGLAGGQGVRARPLTLKAPGYLRSKAAMSFLGRRLIRWVMQILTTEGMKDFYIIAHGKENRYQIKVMIGYGDEFGVNVMYSPVKFDVLNSTLRMLEYWDLVGPSLVFPTDSIIDFDLKPMYRAHMESGATVTVAAMTRAPDQVAEKYGLMLTTPEGRIREFVEKPTLAELREHFAVHEESEFDRLPLLTNAGFYLIDAKALREVSGNAEIASLRRSRLDFGKDLLPWLVGNGHPVYAHTVRRIGDLGNVEDFLDTMVDALHGRFESVSRLLGPPFDPDRRVWIAPESLGMRDALSGKTLMEKLEEGLVTIGPAVRIGRYCEIGPGVVITESNLDDDIEVREGAFISRSQVRDGAMIGPSAVLRDVVIGSMSEIRSEPSNPTLIERDVALGDEVVVHAGVHLAGDVAVYPRLKIPAGISVPAGTDLTGPDDVLRYL